MTKIPIAPHCENCYFARHYYNLQNNAKYYECHHDTPRLGPGLFHTAYWPRVPDIEWCGHHSPKPQD